MPGRGYVCCVSVASCQRCVLDAHPSAFIPDTLSESHLRVRGGWSLCSVRLLGVDPLFLRSTQHTYQP